MIPFGIFISISEHPSLVGEVSLPVPSSKMKGVEPVSKFYRPSLSAKVDFWCVDASNHLEVSAVVRKTKFSQSHPVLPLLLSIDENQSIALWNHDLKQLVWSKSLVQLHSEINAAMSTAAGDGQTRPVVGQYSRARGISRSLARTQDPLATNNENWALFEHVTAHMNDNPVAVPAAVKAATQALGELKFVGFADSQFIGYDSGRLNGNAGLVNTSVNSGQMIANPWACFRNTNAAIDNRLVMLFDAIVVIYHYLTGKVEVITSSDLNNKKPSCVEFLDNEKLAIGCVDGFVRIWNCSSRLVDASFGLSSSNKEVTLIKVLPLEW
jgi:WD40 repeat protein